LPCEALNNLLLEEGLEVFIEYFEGGGVLEGLEQVGDVVVEWLLLFEVAVEVFDQLAEGLELLLDEHGLLVVLEHAGVEVALGEFLVGAVFVLLQVGRVLREFRIHDLLEDAFDVEKDFRQFRLVLHTE